ncbi:MAG: AraC family transcriptional regulator [Ruminococcaceae bacterium]|nr:AraC family transcriptional regulator [Oscillospiraceae bacterium]
MVYNELTERGNENFPVGFYHLDESHPKYIMQHHWHKELEIIRVIKGKLTVYLNNVEIEMTKNDIVFVNPEIVHGAIPDKCVYECMVFDPEKILVCTDDGKNIASGLVNHTLFIYHRIKSDNIALYTTVCKLFNSFSVSDPGYQLSAISSLYELFAVICREKLFTDNTSYSNFLKDKNLIKLKKAIEYMRENYKSQISLDELSKAVDVSPKYFCVIFKGMTGMTAFEYLNAYRIEKASKALISTDMGITEIAFSSGFNDLSYFIKTFKKYKNTTPKLFRNSH